MRLIRAVSPWLNYRVVTIPQGLLELASRRPLSWGTVSLSGLHCRLLSLLSRTPHGYQKRLPGCSWEYPPDPPQ